MGVSSNAEQNGPLIEPMNEIDVNQLPYKHVKNKELYLIKLITKKLSITDNHLSDGLKPTDEDNIIMTRLDIEISEQMKKIFKNKKLKKKYKITINPKAPSYKYDDLKKQLEIANYQWEDLNGEHEEYKKWMKEKKIQDNIIKLRGLHRQDLFYPDDDDDLDFNKNDNENSNKNNMNFFKNQENEVEEEEDEEQ